ncbi:MAG: T9SS type A sorting domain-containing protein [Saprospiraceae bacterium]|nr:T9SS type A sorting domain-containing protein [Saprospiraceae bacterium]
MKKLVTIPVFLYSVLLLQAQIEYNYTWPLGYGSTYDISPEYDGMLLGFGQSPPSLIHQTMLAKPIAFICDATGNLRLYFNGCMLANGQHEIIENSDSVNIGADFSNPPACEGIASSGGYQNALFLQAPGSADLYYLFYIQKEAVPGYHFTLKYALIDMAQNDGHGKVLLKNQSAQLLGAPLDMNTYISAVRHGNGRDWWIVCPTQNLQTRRLVLLLSPAGIQQIYSTGFQGFPYTFTQEGKYGQTGFSADGTKYYRTIPYFGVEITDFNRCTGEFSNKQFISAVLINNNNGGPLESIGAVSSPNGHYLYVASALRLFQFDLWSDSIPATRQVIADFDPVDSGPNPSMFYQGVRAPDGKIYFGSTQREKFLHVIHQPDLPGPACQFEAFGFALPAYQNQILPNFADYSLLDLPGSTCDSLGIDAVTAVNQALDAFSALKIAPNPSSGRIQVSLPASFSGGTICILDAQGRLVLSEKTGESEVCAANLEASPNGLYYVLLRDRLGRPAGSAKWILQK